MRAKENARERSRGSFALISLRLIFPGAFFSLSRRRLYNRRWPPFPAHPRTCAYVHTDGDGRATQARVTRTTCFARRVRSRSDNVSGVFGEPRPPSPADTAREKGTAKRANLSRGDPSRARRGPILRGWGCHGARKREREICGETHGPIAESTGRGMKREG